MFHLMRGNYLSLGEFLSDYSARMYMNMRFLLQTVKSRETFAMEKVGQLALTFQRRGEPSQILK